MSAALSMPAEKRSEPRSRVVQQGVLVWGDYAFTPSCVIRNLTARGAAVRMESELRLPETVTLIEIGAGKAHSARVVWARSGFVGLELVATRDLRMAGSHDPLRSSGSTGCRAPSDSASAPPRAVANGG